MIRFAGPGNAWWNRGTNARMDTIDAAQRAQGCVLFLEPRGRLPRPLEVSKAPVHPSGPHGRHRAPQFSRLSANNGFNCASLFNAARSPSAAYCSCCSTRHCRGVSQVRWCPSPHAAQCPRPPSCSCIYLRWARGGVCEPCCRALRRRRVETACPVRVCSGGILPLNRPRQSIHSPRRARVV